MIRFRSNNPIYRRALSGAYQGVDYEAATYAGVSRKVLYYLAMVLVGAFGGLYLLANFPDLLTVLLPVTLITSIISAFVVIFFPQRAKVFGTIYCLGQGLLVGLVSLAFETLAPGTVLIALMSTVLVLVVVATLFVTRVVVVNSKFMRFLTIFAISMILSVIMIMIFGRVYRYDMSGDYWSLNLLVSGLMVFLATLYLFFDLEHIRQVVEGGGPKMLEWYVSFGLIFTIIWLYLEVLPIVARLLLRRK